MEKEKIGYVYSLNVDLGSGRMLSFNGNFETGASAADMNGEIDKLISVGSRQQAIAMIPQIMEQIEVSERTIAAFEQDMLRLAEEGSQSVRGPMSPEAMERHNKMQAESNLKQHKAALDTHKRRLAEAQAEAK